MINLIKVSFTFGDSAYGILNTTSNHPRISKMTQECHNLLSYPTLINDIKINLAVGDSTYYRFSLGMAIISTNIKELQTKSFYRVITLHIYTHNI